MIQMEPPVRGQAEQVVEKQQEAEYFRQLDAASDYADYVAEQVEQRAEEEAQSETSEEAESSDIHSQLMDQAYTRWQEHNAKVETEYEPRIKALLEKYGDPYHQEIYDLQTEARKKKWSQDEFWAQLDEREKVAVFVGNMNYQVENGGWSQWCYNGYVDCAERLEEILRDEIGTEAAVKVAGMVKAVAQAQEQYEHAKNETPAIDYCTCDEEDECDCETAEDVEQNAALDFHDDVEKFSKPFYAINTQLLQDIEAYLAGRELKKFEPTEDDSEPDVHNARIRCKLIGTDSNAFAIIGHVSEALRRGGRRDLVEPFRSEAMSGDYNGVLQAAMKYVEVY